MTLIQRKEHTYKVRYKIEGGSFKKKDFADGEHGGCDKLVLTSILEPEDGSFSAVSMCFGETPNSVTAMDMFKAWFLMAAQLETSDELGPWQKEILSDVLSKVKSVLTAKDQAITA